MKLILELCVMLFYARFITSASVKLTNKKINVDEFLKTVMNSEKFDEIAEKIADKAVEKFSKLRNIGISTASNATLDEQYAYRVSEVEPIELSDSESKHDNMQTEITTTERLNNNIGKIDTEAFMKKESVDSLKHLSLKYNQFSKSIHSTKPKELNEKQQTENEGVGISREINEDQSLQEENNQYGKRLAGTRAERDKSDVKHSTLKTKATSDRGTNHNILSKKKNIELTKTQEKDDSDSSNEKDSQHTKEDKSMPTSEQKGSKFKNLRASNKGESDQVHIDGSFESDSLHKETIKINEEKNDDSGYKIRQPAYEYLKLPESRKNVVSGKISKHNIKSTTSRLRKEHFEIAWISEKREKPNKSKQKGIPVREERNRLYTFEKSPDYEDYHQTRFRNERKKTH